MDLNDAITSYLTAAVARRLSIHTLTHYITALERFQAYVGEQTPLASIPPEAIDQFLEQLDVARATRRDYRTALGAFWSHAVRAGWTTDHAPRLAAAARLSLAQAVEGYLIAAQARRLSRYTLRDYTTTFRRFMAFIDGDRPLISITADDVRRFMNSLDGLSDKTVLNYHTGLSALWTWALNEDLVEAHILRHVERPRPEQRAITPYTKADVEHLLRACDHTARYTRPGKRACRNQRPTATRDRAIVTLLVDTGIRASELCALRIHQCDLRNRRVTVHGKGKKERTLPISARTAQVVWKYLNTREDRAILSHSLFTTNRDVAFDRHVLKRLIARLGKRAGVSGANVHRFRHTFAINFLRNGGNAFALQRMLGHETLEMVNRYLEIAQADLEVAHRDASPVANWNL